MKKRGNIILIVIVVVILIYFSQNNLTGNPTLPTQFDINKLGRTYISTNLNWISCINAGDKIVTRYRESGWSKITTVKTYRDGCVDNSLRNYSCDGKKPYYIDVNCDNGCEDGKCVEGKYISPRSYSKIAGLDLFIGKKDAPLKILLNLEQKNYVL